MTPTEITLRRQAIRSRLEELAEQLRAVCRENLELKKEDDRLAAELGEAAT